MKIKILCFGKLDNQLFTNLYNFYAEKIQKKVNLEIIELKEVYQAEPKVNLAENTKLLEAKLTTFSDYEKIILDVNSKAIDSIDFAKIIDQNKNFKGAKIIFIVGPSDGFSPEFIKKYQAISFGKITLPHQLFRVVLVEQIYRSLKINANEKYHK